MKIIPRYSTPSLHLLAVCGLLSPLGACASKDDTPSANQRTPTASDAQDTSKDSAELGAAEGGVDAFIHCSKGEMEEDFGVDVPLNGQGVDPDTGMVRAGNYVVASTYLAVEPSRIEQAQQLGGAVIDTLPTLNGLVAYSLSFSMQCAALRTLTVWESEEAMLGLVTSPAHLTAMAKTSEVSRGTSATISWTGSAADATWSVAIEKLRAQDVLH